MADSALGKDTSAAAAPDAGGLRRSATDYALALAVSLLGFAVRRMLDPVLTDQATYIFFTPAIIIASAVGGFGPGLLATVLGVVGGLYFSGDLPSTAAPPRRLPKRCWRAKRISNRSSKPCRTR